MSLRIYNTLSGQKEDFKPLNPGEVKMYVCGVTVYDRCHIGHARAGVVFDFVFRALQHLGYAVTYVRNFTDVDDKIINRAAERGISCDALVEENIAAFYEDMDALYLLRPTHEPRATRYIAQMLAMIQTLIGKGMAYESGGDVFFAVSKFPEYGKLSKKNIDELESGARVSVNESKRDPLDFALWKAAKPGEPKWPSPWGEGRPGWHIECSAMGKDLLGEAFDIHGGGKDLVFPHHENEIAQSHGACGRPPVRYWMHNGFVNINKEKMSKSLGNFFTIRELLDTDVLGGRSWPGEVLRLAMLMTHYREPIDFTAKRLEEAEDKLRGWQRIASAARGTGVVDGSVIEAVSDDLNFHRAAVAIDVIARKANRGVETAVECLAATLQFFGFSKSSLLSDPLVFDHSRIDDAVNARLAALNAKDFARADEIRAALLAEGIQLMDSKNEAGERITKWEVKR